MNSPWLGFGAVAAGALLLVLAVVLVVRLVRRRRSWAVPPEGTLEARLQAFAPLPEMVEQQTTTQRTAETPTGPRPLESSAEEPAQPVPMRVATETIPEPGPVSVPEPSPEPDPEAHPHPPTSRRRSPVEVVADGVVIGVLEGSESHRRFRAAADELLGDLKEARDASR